MAVREKGDLPAAVGGIAGDIKMTGVGRGISHEMEPAGAAFPVEHLVAFGFSPGLVELWRGALAGGLLPLQVLAVSHTALLRGGSVVALAPTSAGKTFVGELAAMRQVELGRRAVFLSPTRALAGELYRHLAGRYGAAGYRVVMATAEFTQDDGAISRGEYDRAVLVYEKFRAFAVCAPDVLEGLGVVVADELQILADAERGECADLLLTRLSAQRPAVQVVGLSAVVDNGEALAQWLGAELLQVTERAAPLREGVYCLEDGRFHYRDGAGAGWLDEELPFAAGGAEETGYDERSTEGAAAEAVVRLCARLAQRGESCLVFVPTRALSRALAGQVARELGWPRETAQGATWEALRLTEEGVLRRQLLECVPAGVAFHNSDLTPDVRELVEQAFNAGELRVIVATPTLAQGVNLKAQNVIQLPVMLRAEGGAGRAGAVAGARQAHGPLSVSRYRNQAGRAGRLGSGVEFGRSILVAQTHAEAVRLGRAYVQAPAEPLERVVGPGRLEHFILDGVAAGRAHNFSTLLVALQATFAWQCGALAPGTALEEELGEAVGRLLEQHLLDEDAGHRLVLTGSGQAMAAGGYQSVTMARLRAAAGHWRERTPEDFEILCACGFTADGEAYPLAASPAEMKLNVWRRQAEKLAGGAAGGGGLLDGLFNPPGGLALAGHSCLKKAVVAESWLSGRPAGDLEEEFRLVAGTMAGLGAHLAWIANGLATCAGLEQCSEVTVRRVMAVAERLPAGLSEEARGLVRLQVAGLGRYHLNRLAAEGFATVRSVKQATQEALERVLPAVLVGRVKGREGEEVAISVDGAPGAEIARAALVADAGAAGTSGEAEIAGPVGDLAGTTCHLVDESAGEAEICLELNLADPGWVRFYGRELRLSPKPYALLRALAERPGRVVTYEELDALIWPDEKVEPQQISAHKSRLVKALAAAAGAERANAAVVTDQRFGLRLALEVGRIRVRGGD